jgi:serine kinase of HPr protein (carbohydrate metabolism regulator)
VTSAPVNTHGTAIKVGNHGLLFTGPSGSGKSMLALTCLAAARRQGISSALVADDRVLISHDEQGRLVASCPISIAGLIEVRGSGIAKLENIESTPLDLAIALVSLPEADRIPPEDETYRIEGAGTLPLLRIWRQAPDPLAILSAFAPRFGLHLPL